MIDTINRVTGLFGDPAPAQASRPAAPRPISNSENRRRIEARFDTQFTTDQNRELWGLADAMSVDAMANWQVRRQLRMRSRYEYHNNSFYQGVADTIGNYVIGVGPQLQMLTINKSLNTRIEKLWHDWAAEIKLANILKNSRVARVHSGEGFAIMRNNPGLNHPVKLDLAEVECDQVTSPLFGMYPAQYPDQFFDGVMLDPWGRPQTYHVLRQHPGAFGAFVLMGTEFDAFPARYVLHDYKTIRPAQQRGIPEALPAVPIFAEMRRYGGAVLGAAETAAQNALTVETDGGAAEPEAIDAMTRIDLRRREATVLPAGWKQSQMKAEQPTTTYDMFSNTKLTEIARCMNIPLFFITLDGRLVNMSSAYVVTQPFAKSVTVDRLGYNILLGRVVDEFLTEAIKIPGLLPKDLPNEFPHTFRWPKIGEHADPNKVAKGRETGLANGTTSIPQLCAEDGLNWEEVQVSQAKALGMSLQEYRAALRQKMFAAAGNPVPAATDAEPNPVDPDSPDSDPPEDYGEDLNATGLRVGGSEGNRPFGGAGNAIRAYSPDQPRDEHGRFSSSGGSEREVAKTARYLNSLHGGGTLSGGRDRAAKDADKRADQNRQIAKNLRSNKNFAKSAEMQRKAKEADHQAKHYDRVAQHLRNPPAKPPSGGKPTPLKDKPEAQAEAAHAKVLAIAKANESRIKGFETRKDNLEAKVRQLEEDLKKTGSINSKKGKEVRALIDKNYGQQRAAWQAAQTIKEKMNRQALDSLRAPEPAQMRLKGNAANNPDVKQGHAEMASLLGKGHDFEHADVSIDHTLGMSDPTHGDRAHFDAFSGNGNGYDGGKGGVVRVSAFDPKETTVHELGHAVEATDKEVHQACIDFLKARTAGEQPQKMSDLTGMKIYKDNEVARPDKFFSPYCGKEYPGHYATEVLSMGAERLVKDPVGFAKDDPEYFKFTVTQLRRGNHSGDA